MKPGNSGVMRLSFASHWAGTNGSNNNTCYQSSLTTLTTRRVIIRKDLWTPGQGDNWISLPALNSRAPHTVWFFGRGCVLNPSENYHWSWIMPLNCILGGGSCHRCSGTQGALNAFSHKVFSRGTRGLFIGWGAIVGVIESTDDTKMWQCELIYGRI